ncbi:MAG: YdiU family protein [Pseudomonadota bacterium]
MALSIPFDNSYARLPERFYARGAPRPVAEPALIKLNRGLARELGLDPEALSSPDGVAMLAGNTLPDGASPISQVYAGHQFGGWVPQLGDGRAHLLGEVIDTEGRRRDIQLKGSGQTPFSRMGDGRAWLGPVLREYIVSEAMHALGVPTTRALAAVTTGETVAREAPFPGAVLTRVAASHIRVGTFQYFASREDTEALQLLTDHAITRHYPEVAEDALPALALLGAVVGAQARLVARWMSLGFIHGVMNTDNTTVSGETIDYGPCAFLDAYHPDKVFSSIDQFGRYAYKNQPDILIWNLAQLGGSLVPLIGPDEDKAVELALEVIHGFPDLYRAEWLRLFRTKLGLAEAEDNDAALIHDLLDRMAAGQADFTNTFRGLANGTTGQAFAAPDALDGWHPAYEARLTREARSAEERIAAMDAANPALIPRNHRVEEAISHAVSGDLAPFERLVAALSAPFSLAGKDSDLAAPPKDDERVLQTFCGT